MTLRRSLLSILALAAFSPAAAAQDDFHILVTNDDGIESPGIQMLAEALRAVGTVHVVAPCGQRSGASMSVSLGSSIEVRDIDEDGVSGTCADTTPANAVMLAIAAMAPEGGFDLVVSGINAGANIGYASHMSGTVGAAMMGALYEVPAVAASLGGRNRDFAYPAAFVAEFVRELKTKPATPGVVFNVNVPTSDATAIEGITVAPMGGFSYVLGYEEVEGEGAARRFDASISLATEAPAGSDTEAFMGNHITITPLVFDWTAHSLLDGMRAWSLDHEVGRD
ncbi:MAG: 5'/3'-nucleotidase SurE [Acidobacteria bacterium]|nr:5'/3'-nucleotidase SurE [Acidobacteriota bacterium]